MTGIERLRKLSEDVVYTSLWNTLLAGREDDWDCERCDDKTLKDTLTAIADQIERESDVETVRSDAMEAWEWVRDHGGLSHVKDIYHDLCAVVERLGIEWSESELHVLMDTLDRRLMPEGCDWEFLKLHMSNLRGFMLDVMDRLGVDKSDSDAPEIAFDALDRRLMPEGMEWRRYEDGEQVRIGGAIADGLGHAHEVTSIEFCKGEVALHWNPNEPEECVWVGHGEPVRRPAVPAGDGEPLEAGQTVWDTDAESDTPLTVVEVSSDLIRCEYTWKDGKTYRPCYPPSVLTHTKPERQNARFGPRTVAAFHREIAGGDSWERIEEDARGLDSGVDRELFTHTHEDLVRRCRALAERDR